MAELAWPIERYADHFVNYLFDEYQGSRHVRRVATWIGFILKAVESVADEIDLGRRRQLQFTYRGTKFKVKYDHEAGARGGIRIIETLPLQGSPEGSIAATLTSLDEAEALYRDIEGRLDAVVDGWIRPFAFSEGRLEVCGWRALPFGKELQMADKRIYVERCEQGDYAVRRAGSERASDVLPTQQAAIERARELSPRVAPHVERVRTTDVGGRDKWRKP